MGMFNDMLGSGESLFSTDTTALDYDYQPKLVPFREKEQQHVISCVKPLMHGRNGRNLIVTGRPGIGKTVVCKHVLRSLEDEEIEEVIPLYVNCWQKNTSYKIFVELCELLGYKFTQNKKTDELFRIVKQILNKKSAVIVFDEVDKADDFDFLYTILEEIYRKTIIMITNYREWVYDIDERIKSRLTPETIQFRPYTSEQIKGILAERKKYAFVEGVWTDEAFELLVSKTAELEDIRTGLYLMKESGNMAEDKSSKKILPEHFESALSKLDEFSIKNRKGLEDETKVILEIVKKNSGKKIGELFKAYQGEGGSGNYKMFQRRISKLAEDMFISTEKIAGGEGGRTTIVKFGTTKKLTEF